MRASRGEIKIEEILAENNIPFKEEYSFPDLLSPKGNELRFDFAVFDDAGDLDYLIEYQGEQHYEPKRKFGGAQGFYKQRTNDLFKREYCQKHGILLIEIPESDYNLITFDYIMEKAGYC